MDRLEARPTNTRFSIKTRGGHDFCGHFVNYPIPLLAQDL
jgi:hypothetical protein